MVGGQARANENVIGRLLHQGEYRIEKILGQGGMGRVFLVSHTTLQVPFAVKQGIADQPMPEAVNAELDRLLHTELLLQRTAKYKLTERDFPLSGGVHTDHFLREALLLARLQHPSLPMLYDYFIEDGYWYLVMDYIPGPTLSAYMYKHAPLPPLEALNYAIQLCDVLDYLHKQRPPVIFRDLKPSNILLSPDGRVMLVDFGIARYFKAGQLNDTTEFGSPGYAPPEQYSGDTQTDARSDLYSLGVILHEMLSGKRPTGMNSPLESLSQLNPAISAVLSGLVSVATRAEPMYRFQSAHAFYLALERAYRIEERRTYIRTLHEVEKGGTLEEPHIFAPLPAEKEVSVFQPTVDMLQRQQTREALQEVRREKLEQERAEMQLNSIDVNLRIRSSSMGFTPLPLSPAAASTFHAESLHVEEAEELPPRSTYPLRRILSTLIGLLLILVLGVASINVFVFLTRQHRSPVQQTPVPTATATSTPTGMWQVLPSLPSPEADNAASYVQVGGRAYIYMNGGFRGPQLTPRYDHKLYRYDIAAAHWEVLDVHNFPGMVNDAVALDEHNRLFFTAGYSSDTYRVASLLYRYAPDTGALEKIVPPGTVSLGFGAAMVADQQGHLYITQGFLHAGDLHGAAGTGWYRYDIPTQQWQLLAPLPVGLGYVVLAPDGAGGILLFGGSTDAGQSSPTQQVYRYDIAQNTWQLQSATSPVPLSGASSCLTGQNQLVVIGGYDAGQHSTLGQSWLVDLHTLHWTPLVQLPSGGSLLGTAACDGNGHVFLTRGANDPNRPTADFWELTIHTTSSSA